MLKKRNRIIIVTNGEKTERLYLEYFKKRIESKKNGELTLDITPMGSKSEPIRIVERAIEIKKE
jgi:TRAP-type C4-dicarboxylate transport system substrate-binding protein